MLDHMPMMEVRDGMGDGLNAARKPAEIGHESFDAPLCSPKLNTSVPSEDIPITGCFIFQPSAA